MRIEPDDSRNSGWFNKYTGIFALVVLPTLALFVPSVISYWLDSRSEGTVLANEYDQSGQNVGSQTNTGNIIGNPTIKNTTNIIHPNAPAIEKSVPQVSGSSGGLVTTPMKLSRQDIETELESCLSQGEIVKCAIRITNFGAKRQKFWLTAKNSYFETADGERYSGGKARHAGQEKWTRSPGEYVDVRESLKFWVEFTLPVDAQPVERIVINIGKKFEGEISFSYGV